MALSGLTTNGSSVAVSGITALGNGTRSRRFYHTTGRALPIHANFVEKDTVDKGSASTTFSRVGAAISAAAFAEGASAMTPTSIPTVNSVALTAAGFGASMAITDDLDYRVTDENDVNAYIDEEIAYALMRYPQIDSSTGIAYQYTQITAENGNTTQPLSRASIMAGANDVWAAVKQYSTQLVCVIEGKGAQDLEDEALAAGGTIYAGDVMKSEVEALVAKNPFLNDKNYLFTIGKGRVHIFLENDPDALITSGGDKVGCVFVPSQEFVGDQKVAPAFALVYKTDPASVSRRGAVEVNDVESVTGPLVMMTRAYVGSKDLTRDGFGAASSGIISQASASRILYVA